MEVFTSICIGLTFGAILGYHLGVKYERSYRKYLCEWIKARRRIGIKVYK
jgi:hypothetical protein